MKKSYNHFSLMLAATYTFAQDTPLQISGSGDLYYK
jgi:hypothetical protein